MKKRDEMEQPTSCLSKAAPDEPIFVLRGKDPIGADVVRTWASKAESEGHHEPAKIAEAREFADEMDAYRERLTEAANAEKAAE